MSKGMSTCLLLSVLSCHDYVSCSTGVCKRDWQMRPLLPAVSCLQLYVKLTGASWGDSTAGEPVTPFCQKGGLVAAVAPAFKPLLSWKLTVVASVVPACCLQLNVKLTGANWGGAAAGEPVNCLLVPPFC